MSSRFTLKVRLGNANVEEFPLGVAGTTVGRDPSNRVRLDGRDVSRFHARLSSRDDGSVLVADRESYGGTWIDGVAIREPRTLGHGQSVRIGSHVLFIVEEGVPFEVPALAKDDVEREESDDDSDDDGFSVPDKPPGPSTFSTARPSADGVVLEVPQSSAPTPETAEVPTFRVTASPEALERAVAGHRAGREAERGVRLIFLAPEGVADPFWLSATPARIGSDPTCEIVVHADGVRPVHATFTRERGALVLTAAEGSGFEVDGNAHSKREIVPGEIVRIGTATMLLANCLRARTIEVRQTPPKRVRPTPSRAAWIASTVVVVLCVSGLALLFRSGEAPHREIAVRANTVIGDDGTPNTPDARDNAPAQRDADAGTRERLTADDASRLLGEARSDVEAFESEHALVLLAAFHDREDLPVALRIDAALVEISALLIADRPDDVPALCATAVRLSGGTYGFLAEQSPRVRHLCGAPPPSPSMDAGGGAERRAISSRQLPPAR